MGSANPGLISAGELGPIGPRYRHRETCPGRAGFATKYPEMR